MRRWWAQVTPATALVTTARSRGSPYTTYEKDSEANEGAETQVNLAHDDAEVGSRLLKQPLRGLRQNGYPT